MAGKPGEDSGHAEGTRPAGLGMLQDPHAELGGAGGLGQAAAPAALPFIT